MASRESSADEDVPSSFLCPITHDIMTDPVSTADGHSYERGAILEWLKEKDTSPLTGAKLAHKMIIDNHTLRCAIDEWKKLKESTPNACAGKEESSSEHYVLKSTGQLVTAKWLVDNRHDLSDCVAVSDFAGSVREELQGTIALSVDRMSKVESAISRVEQVSVRLEANHQTARAEVEQAVEWALEQFTNVLHGRRDAILREIEESFCSRHGVLTEQLTTLSASLTGQSETYRSAMATLDLGDFEIAKAHVAPSGTARAAEACSVGKELPMLHPAVSATLTFQLDKEAITAGCVGVPKAFAWAGVETPEIYGYTDSTPQYTCGQEITPNMPVYTGESVTFRMEPDVPNGLVMDAATGMLLGTPAWDEGWTGDEVRLERIVVVVNDAGSAQVQLPMTLQRDRGASCIDFGTLLAVDIVDLPDGTDTVDEMNVSDEYGDDDDCDNDTENVNTSEDEDETENEVDRENESDSGDSGDNSDDECSSQGNTDSRDETVGADSNASESGRDGLQQRVNVAGSSDTQDSAGKQGCVPS